MTKNICAAIKGLTHGVLLEASAPPARMSWALTTKGGGFTNSPKVALTDSHGNAHGGHGEDHNPDGVFNQSLPVQAL